MLPNQTNKLTSGSIVKETPKLHDAMKHLKGEHDQSAHAGGGARSAGTTAAESVAEIRQIANNLGKLNTENAKLQTQLKTGKAEMARLKSDPSLPKVGPGIRFRTHPVNIQAAENAKLEFEIENNRKKAAELENKLKSQP